MPTFRIRSIAPKESAWSDVVAENDALAAQWWHEKHGQYGLDVVLHSDDGPSVSFVRVEVEGSGTMVSRLYRSGIRRRGGVKPRDPMTVEKIAKILSWDGEPQELLEAGWESESEEWE